MTAQNLGTDKCPKCASRVARSLRYCPSCYAPLAGGGTTKAHLDAAKQIATTHRLDPTLIFLPHEHEALILRRTRRKRFLIAGAVSCVLIAAISTTLYLWNKHHQGKMRAMAREQMAISELNMLADALERYRADTGRYPTEEEGIRSLTNRSKVANVGNLADVSHWNGPYVVGEYELDPWGNDYIYWVTDNGQEFELFSYGPEGEMGGGVRLRVTSRRRFEQ